MIRELRIEFECFTDGKVHIRRPGEEAAYITLSFGEEQRGVTRYYQALNADIHIARVIHVLRRRDIEANFLAEIDGEVFVVKEVQHKKTTYPPVTVLALAEI